MKVPAMAGARKHATMTIHAQMMVATRKRGVPTPQTRTLVTMGMPVQVPGYVKTANALVGHPLSAMTITSAQVTLARMIRGVSLPLRWLLVMMEIHALTKTFAQKESALELNTSIVTTELPVRLTLAKRLVIAIIRPLTSSVMMVLSAQWITVTLNRGVSSPPTMMSAPVENSASPTSVTWMLGASPA